VAVICALIIHHRDGAVSRHLKRQSSRRHRGGTV
jgi:hypothetical protein